MNRKRSYMFPEIEDYREDLEIQHLRTKNHFVIGLLTVMMIMVFIYMLIADFPLRQTLILMFGFLFVILFNIGNLAYGSENNRFYQLNKYLTTLGVYSLALGILFVFASPAAVIVLFIAYAICAFFQDMRIMFISNLFLLFFAIMIVKGYPEYLFMENPSAENNAGLTLFFIAFILILTITSYIIIKQKQFFYSQIAMSKETEFRNLDLLIDLEKEVTKTAVDTDRYYERTSQFLEAFCRKIGIENMFQEKVSILKKLEKGELTPAMLQNHPQYGKSDWERLEQLRIGGNGKLRKSALKMSHTFNVEVKKREIFSETHFKSFNHQKDSLDIKILAFVLFYAALKRGMPGMPELEEADIRSILTSTDYSYTIDPRVFQIYQKNTDVFASIVDDWLKRRDR